MLGQKTGEGEGRSGERSEKSAHSGMLGQKTGEGEERSGERSEKSAHSGMLGRRSGERRGETSGLLVLGQGPGLEAPMICAHAYATIYAHVHVHVYAMDHAPGEAPTPPRRPS